MRTNPQWGVTLELRDSIHVSSGTHDKVMGDHITANLVNNRIIFPNENFWH
jgi:hypothetical protein